jgi:cytosine/adenosine deaminase-related metal-dependent hydrolase
MILNNIKMAGTDEPVNICVDGDKIKNVSAAVISDANDKVILTFDNAIVFPGLINSHDHLDFNLFPQLGDRIYSSYTEWGKHIHKTYKDEIASVLKIPVSLRARWGVYKNLLCGVTTVVNHGEVLGLENDLITVFEKTQVLHSVQFEKGWKFKLNNPFKGKLPVNIHVGEGDDWPSFHEIDQLTGWNLLRKKLIGIHAVAMSEDQAKKFKAIVWCPESNYFLLNKTGRVNLLKDHTSMLFGTDSTLTSSWDIWGHLRLARKTKLLSDNKLYQAINQNAAHIWQLTCGEIAPGKDADMVVAKIKPDSAGFDSFFGICPADLLLIVHKGNIRLFDETLSAQLKGIDQSNFSKIHINGSCKYVQGDLPGLMEKIRGYNLTINFPASIN